MKYFRRFHYYDEQGKKHIVSLPIDQEPLPHFKPGNGPMNEEHYQHYLQRIQETITGKPKTITQRLRMSQAKLGVPKSQTHRENMRQAQLERSREIRLLQEKYPELSYREAGQLLTQQKKINNR
jgi:hypothetical protein